jgi:hypothetical protein
LLQFAVTDEHRAPAISLVNEYAKTIHYVSNGTRHRGRPQSLKGIAKRIDRVQTQLRATTGDQSLLRQQLSVLLNKQQDLRNLEALQGGNLFVVQAGRAPPHRFSHAYRGPS